MMKISKSLRDIYLNQNEQYNKLKRHVDEYISLKRDPRWHYESRIKDEENFALKIESGRYNNLNNIEDFFACTLVVENLDRITVAENLVRGKFKLHERRPKKKNFTSKPSDSFRFDDTRLYVKWKDDSTVRPTGLNGLLFEVQIKTFLSHAWSIATHDLTYKTDEKSWPKERIAFQIKAMLEHAEISIQEAKKLAKSTSLKKTDKLSKRISEIIKFINDLWDPLVLPKDKKRLAENIYSLIYHIGIDLQTLQNILTKETELGKGSNTLNLSPFTTIIQSLFNQEPNKMIKYLKGREHEFKIFLPKELELPPSIELNKLKNAILDVNN